MTAAKLWYQQSTRMICCLHHWPACLAGLCWWSSQHQRHLVNESCAIARHTDVQALDTRCQGLAVTMCCLATTNITQTLQQQQQDISPGMFPRHFCRHVPTFMSACSPDIPPACSPDISAGMFPWHFCPGMFPDISPGMFPRHFFWACSPDISAGMFPDISALACFQTFLQSDYCRQRVADWRGDVNLAVVCILMQHQTVCSDSVMSAWILVVIWSTDLIIIIIIIIIRTMK